MTAAILCGALVGFMLALVGGGGSILATPLLLYGVGISQPHLAIGTGALAVSFNAFTNFAAYARRGHVWWHADQLVGFAPVPKLDRRLESVNSNPDAPSSIRSIMSAPSSEVTTRRAAARPSRLLFT